MNLKEKIQFYADTNGGTIPCWAVQELLRSEECEPTEKVVIIAHLDINNYNSGKPYIFKTSVDLKKKQYVSVNGKIAQCLTDSVQMTEKQIDFLAKSQGVKKIRSSVEGVFELKELSNENQ